MCGNHALKEWCGESIEARVSKLKHKYPMSKISKFKVQQVFKKKKIRYKKIKVLHKVRDRELEM